MLLMIDNYDSFTYNLVQYLGELGEEVKVVRNDEMTVDEIEAPRARAHRDLARPVHAQRGRRLARRSSTASRAACRSSASASATRRSARPSAARSCTRRRSCTARSRASTTTARACSAACRRPTTRPATTRSRSSARRCPAGLEVTAWTEDGEIMGVRHRSARRSRACSSIPSRSSPSTATRCCSNFLTEQRR